MFDQHFYTHFLEFTKRLNKRRGKIWLTVGDACAFKIKRDQFQRLLDQATADQYFYIEAHEVTKGRVFDRYYMTDKFAEVKIPTKYDLTRNPRAYLERWFRKITYNNKKPIAYPVARFNVGPIKSTEHARLVAAKIIKDQTVQGVEWAPAVSGRRHTTIIFNPVEKETK